MLRGHRCVPATGLCENIDTVTATCNDQNACTADTCVPGTGQCAHEDVPSCAGPDLNHFQCYEIHGKSVRQTVDLVDDIFDPTTATVGKPKRLCAPANKNDTDPTAPGDPDHLIAYRLHQTAPRVTDRQRVEFTDQFGPHTLTITRADMLLVPSAKSVPPAAKPMSYVPGIDHFKCHRVVGVRFEHIPGNTVDDQFLGTIDVDLKRPRRFCVAVSKQVGEGPVEPRLDPAARLLCYRERSRAGRPSLPDGSPWVLNQFVVPAEQFAVFGPRELCVPVQPDPGAPTPTTTPTPTVTATPTLTPTPTATVTPGCGNGVIDPGEECEGFFTDCLLGGTVPGGLCDEDCVCKSVCGETPEDKGQSVHRVRRVKSAADHSKSPAKAFRSALVGAPKARSRVRASATRTSRRAAAPVRRDARAIQ